jgi:hypothetical protein
MEGSGQQILDGTVIAHSWVDASLTLSARMSCIAQMALLDVGIKLGPYEIPAATGKGGNYGMALC